MVQTVKGPTTYSISDGRQNRTVYVNRLCLRVQPAQISHTEDSQQENNWWPETVDHESVDFEEVNVEPRYPSRTRRPPDYFQVSLGMSFSRRMRV